ncbi:MAG: SdpI family protein [Lachnospiraceae bacterium]
MWFWWFMLCCDVLMPVFMIIAGRWMWKRPPKTINGTAGYRSSRSMMNMDTWKFAHDYCGRLWWKIGWIMLVPSILIHIPLYGGSENAIGITCGILITIQTIVLIVSIFPTEKALKRTFTDSGQRR